MSMEMWVALSVVLLALVSLSSYLVYLQNKKNKELKNQVDNWSRQEKLTCVWFAKNRGFELSGEHFGRSWTLSFQRKTAGESILSFKADPAHSDMMFIIPRMRHIVLNQNSKNAPSQLASKDPANLFCSSVSLTQYTKFQPLWREWVSSEPEFRTNFCVFSKTKKIPAHLLTPKILARIEQWVDQNGALKNEQKGLEMAWMQESIGWSAVNDNPNINCIKEGVDLGLEMLRAMDELEARSWGQSAIS